MELQNYTTKLICYFVTMPKQAGGSNKENAYRNAVDYFKKAYNVERAKTCFDQLLKLADKSALFDLKLEKADYLNSMHYNDSTKHYWKAFDEAKTDRHKAIIFRKIGELAQDENFIAMADNGIFFNLEQSIDLTASTSLVSSILLVESSGNSTSFFDYDSDY